MVKVNKILVSQPRPSSDKSPYFDIEKKYGVEIVFRPFIKVEGLTSKEFRQQKISLPEHTAVIFTAKSAIDHFFRIAEEKAGMTYINHIGIKNISPPLHDFPNRTNGRRNNNKAGFLLHLTNQCLMEILS